MVFKRFNQWLKRRGGIPLCTLLIVPFMLEILGVVAIVGYLSYRSGEKAVEELTNQLMLEIGDRIIHNLEDYLQTSDEIAKINAQLIDRGVLDWRNKAELENYFVEQINIFSEASSIYIATEQKDFLIVAKSQPDSLIIREWNPDTGDLENYAADLQGNRLYLRDGLPNYDPHNDPPNDPWYAFAKAAKNGGWRMVTSGVKRPNLTLVMVRSLPFYDSRGNLEGVVGAAVHLDRMNEFLGSLKIGKTGQAFIIDQRGFLIATSTDEVPFYQTVFSAKLETANPDQWRVNVEDSRHPVTREVGKYIRDNFENVNSIDPGETIKLNGESERYYIQVFPYSLDENNNWFIVLTVPQSDFMGKIFENLYKTVLLCATALILAIYVALFAARCILKSVKKLNLAAHKVAENNLNHPIEKSCIREVNQLADSFDQMAQNLGVSFQHLQFSENRFSTLLDNVPIGVAVFDPTGKLILLNKVGQQISGQRMRSIYPEQLAEVYQIYIAGTDEFYPTEQLPGLRALKGEKVCVGDMEIEVEGRRIPLEVTSIPVFDESGAVIYAIIMFQDITERRQNEEFRLNYARQLEGEIAERTLALQKSEERLQMVIDSTLDGIWDWDIINNTAWWSPQLYKLLGFPPAEVELNVINRFLKLVYPDDRPRLQEALKNHWEKDEHYNVELRVRRGDNSYGWYLAKAQAFKNQNGEPYRMVGSFSDINERKQLELNLQDSEAQLNSILNTALAGIICFRFYPDTSIQYDYISQKCEEIFGYTVEELMSNSELWRSRIHLQDWEDIVRPKIEEALRHRRNFTFSMEYRFYRKDGSISWILGNGFSRWNQAGGYWNITVVDTDITDRKRAELALQESEKRFRLALNNAPDVVVLYDRDRRFLYVNLQGQQRTGRPLEYFIGKRDEDLFPEEVTRQYLPLLKKTYTEKTSQIGECTIKLSEQDPYTIIVKYAPILDAQGSIREVLAITLDISDRKRAEELIYQSEAHYLSILEAQTELVTRFQPDGNLSFVNDAFCRYFGVKKKEVIGHSYKPRIYPEDQLAIDRCLADLSPQKPVGIVEHRAIVNSTLRWMQWTNQAIYDAEGNLVELQSVGRDIDDRKQAEIALQRTTQELQAFLDNAPAIIHLFDAEERYLRVNRAFTQLFNLPEEEIIGRTFSDFFSEDIVKTFRMRINQIIETGEPVIVEDEVAVNGELKIFESSIFHVNYDGGKPTTFGTIVTDITERKRTELELRKSRDLRDAIFHESADALFLVDSNTLLTIDCNRRAVELFEAESREELIGIEGHTLQKRQFTPEEMEQIHQDIDRKGVWSLEVEYITKTGRYFWGNLAVKQVKIAEKHFNLVRVTDISDRKFAEQALYESEKELRLLADALPVFISYADSEERYQFVNRKYEEEFGMTREEICGKTILEIVGEVSHSLVCKYIKRALAGEFVRYEITVPQWTASQDRHFSAMLIPDLDEDAKVKGFYSLILDISDRKRMELELQKAKEAAEANSRAKGAFIANMSHELRSPLNAILGFARILKNDPELSSDQRKNAELIQVSGEHLLNLINQVLDLAKIEANRTVFEPNDFNLDKLIEDIYNMFFLKAESKGLALNVQKTPDVLGFIRTDEMKLRQVLINLLSNAVKFTERGEITLRVFVASESANKNVMLNFEVEDTGVGISSAEQAHLFEAFAQTEAGRKIQEGTGLGLAITQEFVRLMGGKIAVESQLDAGSTFRFNLPAKIADPVQIASSVPRKKIIALAPGQPLYRLLVVDDNLANRRLLVQLLKPLGFAVEEANNGVEAINLWQQSRPHLIWMDLRMPVLDGWEATKQIRQLEQSDKTDNPAIIVGISANRLSDDPKIFGFNDFIHKPFEELEIFTALEWHLGAKYSYAKIVPQNSEKAVNTVRWVETVARLSDSGLKELEDALILGDPQFIQQKIRSLEKDSPHLSAALTPLVERFEYGQIINVIRSVR